MQRQKPTKRASGWSAASSNQGVRALCLLAWLAAGAQPAPSAADAAPHAPPPVELFAQHPTVSSMQISPDGQYLVATAELKGGPGIVVLQASDNHLVGAYPLGDDYIPLSIVWVGPRRFVIEPGRHVAFYEVPIPTGELIAMNVDGSDRRYLFGPHSEASHAGPFHTALPSTGYARVIGRLPDDPHHALISVLPFDNTLDTVLAHVYEIDLEDGSLSHPIEAPGPGPVQFFADAHGHVVLAEYAGKDLMHPQLYRRDHEQWQRLDAAALHASHLKSLALAPDGSRVWLASDAGSDRLCLDSLDLASMAVQRLSCDPEHDVSAVILSTDRQTALAAYYREDRPHFDYLQPDSPQTALLQKLAGSFPDEIVQAVSSTDDGHLQIVLVQSDRDPGSYYLFDTRNISASLIAARRDGADPDTMPERRPVRYAARDGLRIHAELTLPPGTDNPHKLPMVVLPHGGPFGISDNWIWDEDAAVLATRGYLVLQVNFRGSDGYGDSFEAAGQKDWGGGMIDDITDGVRWAVAQGFADDKRICISGASYGGYAALMSAEREPQLYRCVVDFAGVYDLQMMKKTSDVGQSSLGRDYFKDWVGASPEQLKAASPRSHIEQLQAPVLIVHGSEDLRVPLDQAKALRDDLQRLHKPYSWLVKDGEFHGFYQPANQAEFYRQELDFMAQAMGSGKQATQ